MHAPGKLLLSVGLLSATSQAAPIVFSVAGPNPAAIQATVDAFRGALGTLNPNVAGSLGSGRREINWDGAGANPFDNKNDFPAGFFNSNVKAGAVFTTPGTGFRNDSTDFAEINPAYATQFTFFSANCCTRFCNSARWGPSPAIFKVMFGNFCIACSRWTKPFSGDSRPKYRMGESSGGGVGTSLGTICGWERTSIFCGSQPFSISLSRTK